MSAQPEALRLADAADDADLWQTAAELRRLHAENESLKATQYGSGRMQALRVQRDQLLEALSLANLLLSGANMNRAVVEKKVLAAIAACQPQPTVAHLPADDTEGGAA
jgi:hypothetical protein